jgi:K+-sensing histidine kinase KdpD
VSINQQLDMFPYKTSHDFRSPITTLLVLSAVARYELENTAEDRAIRLFNCVKETATAMDKLLEKLN